MKGLEPSTFCMARTWREATGGDWSRHSSPLCGFPALLSVRNRQRPTWKPDRKPDPPCGTRPEQPLSGSSPPSSSSRAGFQERSGRHGVEMPPGPPHADWRTTIVTPAQTPAIARKAAWGPATRLSPASACLSGSPSSRIRLSHRYALLSVEAFEPPGAVGLGGNDFPPAAVAEDGGVAVAIGDAAQPETRGAAGERQLLGLRPCFRLRDSHRAARPLALSEG